MFGKFLIHLYINVCNQGVTISGELGNRDILMVTKILRTIMPLSKKRSLGCKPVKFRSIAEMVQEILMVKVL